MATSGPVAVVSSAVADLCGTEVRSFSAHAVHDGFITKCVVTQTATEDADWQNGQRPPSLQTSIHLTHCRLDSLKVVITVRRNCLH